MKKLKMKPNNTNGYLFTFCGLDGSGKTTMINRIREDLEDKYQLYFTKQPTNAVRNSEIFRNYMDSSNHQNYDYRSLSLLAASDRIQHVSKVIEPQMDMGNIVISDRYFYSCLANLRARGFVTDRWIYEVAKNIIMPDIAFFFDVPVDTAISRVRSRKEEKDRYIDLDLQFKLRKEYKSICKANGGILIPTNISADESYEIVRKEINKVLDNGNKK